MSYAGLVAGLGNPGARYDGTLHNCGFMFADRLLELAKKDGYEKELSGKKFNSFLWEISLPDIDGKWLLCKPQTFMNDSGKAIAPLLNWFKLKPRDLVVVQDELDLPPGSLRFKFGGGLAGHNGLLSITQCLGTKDYYRLRIGIGKPENRDAVINWVLGHPSGENRQRISTALDKAITTFIIFCDQGAQQATMYAKSIKN